MNLIGIEVENIKKLKLVNVRFPASGLFRISGRNESGKTSFMDAIKWAVGGAAEIQPMPIRKGCERASIKLDCGTVIVTRKFTSKGTTVTVENADGSVFRKPQEMLDKLYTATTFDPFAFTKMTPAQQYKQLRQIVKLDVDIDALELKNKADYDSRAAWNKLAKDKAAQAKSERFTFAYPEMDALISLADLAGEIAAASNRNSALSEEGFRRKKIVNQTVSLANEIFHLEKQLVLKKKEHADKLAEQAAWKPLGEHESLEELRLKVDEGEKKNAEHQLRQEQTKLMTEAETAKGKSELLTSFMEARDTARADAIAAAVMPIAGLGFGDGHVLFDGVPFVQAATSDQIRISCGIAMAASPELRVALVRDASLMQEDKMQQLAALAERDGFLVLVEQLGRAGSVGIVLEDGELVATVDAEGNETVPETPEEPKTFREIGDRTFSADEPPYTEEAGYGPAVVLPPTKALKAPVNEGRSLNSWPNHRKVRIRTCGRVSRQMAMSRRWKIRRFNQKADTTMDAQLATGILNSHRHRGINNWSCDAAFGRVKNDVVALTGFEAIAIAKALVEKDDPKPPLHHEERIRHAEKALENTTKRLDSMEKNLADHEEIIGKLQNAKDDTASHFNAKLLGIWREIHKLKDAPAVRRSEEADAFSAWTNYHFVRKEHLADLVASILEHASIKVLTQE